MSDFRKNRFAVVVALREELNLFPEDAQASIYTNFMTNYDRNIENDVFDQPRRSLNGMRSDICYWRMNPDHMPESEMYPFMGFALKYFLGNWMTNWIYSFYDKNGDLLDRFNPIVN
jgi:hypothetical protein